MESNDLRVVHLNEIWYVPLSDVLSVGYVQGEALVTLKNEKLWTPLYFTPGSATFEESHSEEGRNWAIAQRLSASLPGEDMENTLWVDDFNNRPVLLKIVQNNGTKLLGSTDIPCRMKISSSVSESGFVIRVERKSRERARWLT